MTILVLWILFAFLGGIFAFLARRDAKRRLKELGLVTNGRRRLGRGHVRDETIVLVIDATWFLIGVLYFASGERPQNSIAGIPLVGTSVLLSISTAMRWRDRRYAEREET